MSEVTMSGESANRLIALRNGRSMEIREVAGSSELLELRSPAGDLELSIELTDQGARLTVRAVDIDLSAARALRMRCETAELLAEKSVRIEAGTDLSLDAVAGGARLSANDDVDVRGERVLLNPDVQPMATSVEEFESELAARALGKADR